MAVEVLILRQGDARYEEMFGQLRADRALLADLWAAAESRLDEHPGKTWIVAVEAGVPVAWCAYEPTDEQGAEVKCVDSYERREAWGRGLYARVFWARHRLIRRAEAITYVFAQPLGLHLSAGWRITGEGDRSEPGIPSHHWYELRRSPGDVGTYRRPRA
ncbi:MAG TPA: hypothetical protein VHA75_20240 [Rugosimonospora sp.]|nr:hypothetical protein [Rugosimonospora sp.]